MMQTQIPSGLQALIQASQVLSSQASPTAPGPQGPQPTVAERVNQQIKQATQPQMPPNVRDIGQQAGIAGQIMAQKQAQQQQTAQNPEAVAQMAAQMLQGQGVAGLPVKMGFKSGGIIGFDGESGSSVPAAREAEVSGVRLTEEEKQRQIEHIRYLMEALKQGSANVSQTGKPSNVKLNPADISRFKEMLGSYRPELLQAAGYTPETPSVSPPVVNRPAQRPASGIAATLPSAQQPAAPARPAPAAPTAPVAPAAQVAPVAPAAPATSPAQGIEQVVEQNVAEKKAALPQLVNELRQSEEMLRAATRSGDPRAAQLYAQKVAKARKKLEEMAKLAKVPLESLLSGAAAPAAPPAQAAPPAAAPAPAPAAAPPAAQRREEPAAQRAASPQSYANEVKARTEGILSGLTPPTTQSILEQAKKLAPSDVEARVKEHKQLEAERDKLRGGQEELYKQAFENLEKDKEARKQILKSREERDQFNRVMSFFRDLATNGTSYWNVQEGIFARQEADRLADFSHNKSMLELKKAQQAEKVGDVERKMGHLEKYNEWKDKAQFYTLQAADLAVRTQTGTYDKQVGARISAADMLSREKIDKSRASDAAKKLEIMSQERKDAGLNSRIMMAQGRLTDAWKVYEKTKEENKLGLSISEEDAKKDPTAKQMRDKALKDLKETYDTVVAPAIETHNRLADEVFGKKNSAPRAAPTNTADPLNIRQTS
jgi:hypothetical protein